MSCRGTCLTRVAGLSSQLMVGAVVVGFSAAGVEGLASAGGIEVELAGELTGDEYVTVGAGDDHGCLLVVVGSTDSDAVLAVDVSDAVVDGYPVDFGGGVERLVDGSGFGVGVEHVDRGETVEAAVGSVMVVDEGELVELVLEIMDGFGPGSSS